MSSITNSASQQQTDNNPRTRPLPDQLPRLDENQANKNPEDLKSDQYTINKNLEDPDQNKKNKNLHPDQCPISVPEPNQYEASNNREPAHYQ